MAPLAQTLALLAMTMATTAIKLVPLDMAQNSNTGKSKNCKDKITVKLPELTSSDFLKNDTFSQAWANATAEWQKQGSYSPNLTKDQAITLMVYTANHVYSEFNKAVHTAGNSSQEYRENFYLKTLNFLLTDVLQKLSRHDECQDVFRGVKDVQFNVTPGDKVHLSQFALSSLNETVAQGYGADTMFKVHTCHGVDIPKFSFNESEKEVLIPPFEIFEVTKVTREGEKVQIELHSTKSCTVNDCKPLKGGSLPRNSPHLGWLLLATVAMAVAFGTI